ncbi:hypothetical protein CASFOL_034333 [Castilleja foliolosa]|uniref:Glycine-rich protein n=1 Tax=Castilleja foliolosa TaxID=1961234 RepID=A0ABD3BX61_9LAMI
MMSKSFITITLVLLSSVVADQEMPNNVVQDQINGDGKTQTTIGGGYGGGESGSGSGYSAGFSHGGVYVGGKICKFGCCSESYGYSHGGGSYYGCTCCSSFVQAKAYAYAQRLAKAHIKN